MLFLLLDAIAAIQIIIIIITFICSTKYKKIMTKYS